MQRNHGAVAPSTSSPQKKAQWALDLPPITSSTSPFNLRWEQMQSVRYSLVRRNKPYSSNKKHLPQLPQPEFTDKSRMYKCGNASICGSSRKERLWKKSTQHRWPLFRRNGFNSFNRKISYAFIGIYLLYYLLNRYYKCCRMLKMVLTGCCRVLKDVERVLNGVGMIKCAKWTCCSCWKRWTAFRGKWTISQGHEKCRPLKERHRRGETEVIIHPLWWDHRPHRG